MINEKYMEIFGSMDLLTNEVHEYDKYLKCLQKVIAKQKGIDLDTCDPSESSEIFDYTDDLIAKNSLGVKFSDNIVINDGLLHIFEKMLLDRFKVNKIEELSDNLDKSKDDVVNKLMHIVMLRQDLINNKYANIIKYIWETYKDLNKNINKNDVMPFALNTVFSVILMSRIKDASNMQSLVLYKLKNESTEDINRLSEMYTYMPELFDHYFYGYNIFKI
jgi:hypothetical protein|nr:MAG TPA: hypothetical protein [Caudoviricetes sp.]